MIWGSLALTLINQRLSKLQQYKSKLCATNKNVFINQYDMCFMREKIQLTGAQV